MNIIEELYYGNVDPQKVCCKISTRENKLLCTIADKEKILSECLEGENKDLFLELLDANSELIGTMGIEHFMIGWKLGAQFMLDTFLQEL